MVMMGIHKDTCSCKMCQSIKRKYLMVFESEY